MRKKTEGPSPDNIYDGKFKDAVERALNHPKVKEFDKHKISECYWYIGHDIADGRYGKSTMYAYTLEGALDLERKGTKEYFERNYPGDKELHKMLWDISKCAKEYIDAVRKMDN